jgi:nucleotide-binding universal stress UspA family protein
VRRGAELDAEIVDEARQRGSDLIIARRRGKRGFLARLLVGEMVSRVVAHSPCSVLLVPRTCDMWTQRVLLALDPAADPATQTPLMRTAVNVAAECSLPLTVVCVVDGTPATIARATALMEQASAYAANKQVTLQSDQRSGKAFEQIVATAQTHGADLLVMGRHGGALSGRAWLGSTTQKVIGLAERPVLVVIPKES